VKEGFGLCPSITYVVSTPAQYFLTRSNLVIVGWRQT
jgi:hypothetical protein